MKEFCPYCSKITKNKFVTRDKKINVRGETILVTYKARMCTECSDFFMSYQRMTIPSIKHIEFTAKIII